MDDAQYVFKQDSKEKKQIANSASKRVGKSKKCTFPFEAMTPKERKNYMAASEVETFVMRRMTLTEFKEVPGDKKIELLKWYGEKFGWNAAGVAFGLNVSFHKGQDILEKHMLTAVFKRRMKEATKEQKRQFMDNRKKYAEMQLSESKEAPVEEKVFVPPVEENAAQAASKAESYQFVIQLDAKDKDGETLKNQLFGIGNSLAPGERYEVSVRVRSVSAGA